MISLLGITVDRTVFYYICFLGEITCYLVFAWGIWKGGLTTFTGTELGEIYKTTDRILAQRRLTKRAKKKRENILELYQIFDKLKIFNYSKDLFEDYASLISKLDIKDIDGQPKLAEEYLVSNSIKDILIITVALCASLFNPVCFALIITISFINKMSYKKLYRRYLNEIKEIEHEMPELISTLYFRYGRKEQFDLEALILDCRPMMGQVMARMLTHLEVNAKDLNEEDALELLLNSYQESNYVYSFCSVTLGICRQQDNAYVQLQNLYDEINLRQEESYVAQKEERIKKMQKASLPIYGLFCAEVIIFLIFQIGGN